MVRPSEDIVAVSDSAGVRRGRLAPGTTLASGRYTIVELLGVGAFGEVYRATDQRTRQPLSIRLIAPDLLRLENLESLDLAETGFTDAGLAQLSGMKSLKRLYLGASKVTAEGAAKFRNENPQVHVSWHEPAPDYDTAAKEESPE